eukprot:6529717-Alexandrium_andersonii.AAC.1
MAAHALAHIVTQGGVTIARAVGGAQPLARPEAQTARGCTILEFARLRRGARSNVWAARPAHLGGPT